jgi:hypothetical protein
MALLNHFPARYVSSNIEEDFAWPFHIPRINRLHAMLSLAPARPAFLVQGQGVAASFHLLASF